MLDPHTAGLLESGCALIVGTSAEDGSPWASRAWGMRCVGADRLRVVLPEGARRDVGHFHAGRPIAVTGGDVRTLQSVQVKGRVVTVEDVTESDLEVVAHYTEEFFTAVEETDGTPRHLLERMLPASFVACEVEVGELYDQTPGPRAGGALTGPPP